MKHKQQGDRQISKHNAVVMTFVSGLVPTHFVYSSGVSVKDLGRFTREGVSPYCMLIGLDAVFALARQHWIYEKFSEYSKGLESVLIVRLRSRYNSRSIMRLIWDNKGSPSRSQAQVLNQREWRGSRYRSKSKELVGLTDVQLVMQCKDRVLAFL